MPRFKNPVLPGCYPDPSVCRVGDDYYLVASSFVSFPGLPIFHSQDLVSWKQLGHCLHRPSQVRLCEAPSWGGIWAPTIRFHDGLFYVATTNISSSEYFASAKSGNFIITATSPEGPWSDPVSVEQPGIDPSLFFDDDGSVYFTTSHEGALQSAIDVKTGKLLTEPQVIWSGSGGKHPEGPHLYRKEGEYYLLLSEGGTEYGHMITMARSKSAGGPFEACSQNPLLTHRSRMSPIQGVGHADLVQTPDGAWFAVCLAFRPKGYPPCHHLGRETFLCPVTWPEGDFPRFGAAGMLDLEQETSLSVREPARAEAARDEFDHESLGLAWSYLRDPELSRYSLRERPGFLRLEGSPVGLDDAAGSPSWLGQRQRHFEVRATTCLEFQPSTEREEAGLVVSMNERHHYEVFVSVRDGAPTVVLRRRIGSLVGEVAKRPLGDATRVVLRVAADDFKYVFSCGLTEEALEVLGEGETRYLSTEVAGGFTGVWLALYATGNGAPCVRPADFDWFEYEPVA